MERGQWLPHTMHASRLEVEGESTLSDHVAIGLGNISNQYHLVYRKCIKLSDEIDSSVEKNIHPHSKVTLEIPRFLPFFSLHLSLCAAYVSHQCSRIATTMQISLSPSYSISWSPSFDKMQCSCITLKKPSGNVFRFSSA